MAALAAGCLVVARPELSDPQFMRGVVYVLEHHAGGSMGLLINRPLALPLGSVWEHCPESLAASSACASGGPVELHKGLLLHGKKGIKDAFEVADGLYIGGDTQALRRWLGQADAPTSTLGPRLFLGHAGWGAGQLQAELTAGSWLLCPGHPQLALDNEPDDDLWETLIRVGGGVVKPSLN